ncbi:MAG: cytochrome c [Polyangiaceae bacterium]
MNRVFRPVILGLFGALSGCAGSSGSAKSSNDAAPPANFKEQVARGAVVYAAQCSNCHGGSGEGKPGAAPRIVGAGALPLDPPATARVRTERFITAADVAGFVVKNMPPRAPGSLSNEDYFSVLAFDLKANGIDLGEQKLDAALAATLTIPR